MFSCVFLNDVYYVFSQSYFVFPSHIVIFLSKVTFSSISLMSYINFHFTFYMPFTSCVIIFWIMNSKFLIYKCLIKHSSWYWRVVSQFPFACCFWVEIIFISWNILILLVILSVGCFLFMLSASTQFCVENDKGFLLLQQTLLGSCSAILRSLLLIRYGIP